MTSNSSSSFKDYYGEIFSKDKDMDALEIEVKKAKEAIASGEYKFCNEDLLEIDYVENFVNYYKYDQIFDIEALDRIALGGHLQAIIHRIRVLGEYPASNVLIRHLNSSIDAIVKYGNKSLIDELAGAIIYQHMNGNGQLGITEKELSVYGEISDSIGTKIDALDFDSYYIRSYELSVKQWDSFIHALLEVIKHSALGDQGHYIFKVSNKLHINYQASEHGARLDVIYKNKRILREPNFNRRDCNQLICMIGDISEIISGFSKSTSTTRYCNLSHIKDAKSDNYFEFALNN
ncbi:MAG: hypothetical protein RSD49_06730 [Hafnia sp.]